jgi:hypothetical protein
MAVMTFRLSLSRQDLLRVYRGQARSVQAHTLEGRSVQFPASVLRRYVTPEGVHGTFRLHTDRMNRLLSFERLETFR